MYVDSVSRWVGANNVGHILGSVTQGHGVACALTGMGTQDLRGQRVAAASYESDRLGNFYVCKMISL